MFQKWNREAVAGVAQKGGPVVRRLVKIHQSPNCGFVPSEEFSPVTKGSSGLVIIIAL